MTTNFSKTYTSVDRRLGQQGRRVLLCLDNCSGHPPELQLNNIRGIIKNLKRHKKILLCRLEAIDIGKEFEFTLLDALIVR